MQGRLGGNNLPSTVVIENRQIHIPDLDNLDPSTADWPGLPPARKAGTRTMCGTPLRRDGKAIGVLVVYRSRLLPFTAEELALQQSFADQAVIAIENARLFNETREALERQTATADILKVIASSPIGRAAGVRCHCGQFQPADRRLRRLRCTGSSTTRCTLPPSRQPPRPATRRCKHRFRGRFPPAPWGENIRNGETVHIPDAEIEWAGQPTLLEMARLRGFRSLLFVPLLRDGTTIGLISVTRKEPGRFSPHHVQLLQTFADQAVIAIENTRLFNETREALERQTVTAEILKVIAGSPSDVQPVFDAIAGSAQSCSSLAPAITTLKDDKLHWNATAASISGFDVDRVRTVYPIPFDEERSPSTRAILERRIIEIPDVAAPDTPEFTRNAAAAGGFKSITFVPLVDQEQGIGTIIFTNPQTGFRFSERQLALIRTFADQAVIAIQNVRQFNETREALAYQTGSSNILRVIASSPTDVEPVLKAIVESARELCEANDAVVLLSRRRTSPL